MCMIDNAPCSTYDIIYENISTYDIAGCVRGWRVLTSVIFYFPGLTDFILYHSSLLQFLSGRQKNWMLVFRNSSPILLLKS